MKPNREALVVAYILDILLSFVCRLGLTCLSLYLGQLSGGHRVLGLSTMVRWYRDLVDLCL